MRVRPSILLLLLLLWVRKKNLEIENAGMSTAPGGRPTQSRHVIKQN